jgi:hypothetical protein
VAEEWGYLVKDQMAQLEQQVVALVLLVKVVVVAMMELVSPLFAAAEVLVEITVVELLLLMVK